MFLSLNHPPASLCWDLRWSVTHPCRTGEVEEMGRKGERVMGGYGSHMDRPGEKNANTATDMSDLTRHRAEGGIMTLAFNLCCFIDLILLAGGSCAGAQREIQPVVQDMPNTLC